MEGIRHREEKWSWQGWTSIIINAAKPNEIICN
jgi:hypothetical protein